MFYNKLLNYNLMKMKKGLGTYYNNVYQGVYHFYIYLNNLKCVKRRYHIIKF